MSPQHFGVVLFPQFEPLDAFGPLEAWTMLTRFPATPSIQLYIIADSLQPVSTGPVDPKSPGGNFGHSVVPTHTFADFENPGSTPKLDILLVPGGPGTRGDSPRVQRVIDFIRKIFPRLQYLMTVCTGAGLAARAGVLDGHRATTNKRSWAQMTALGPKTHWIARARWVVSGNVWTTSGVAAGIDGAIAWIAEVFGEEAAAWVTSGMEYPRQVDAGDDPFAPENNCDDVPPVEE